jgi:hypothetical protein
LILSIFEGNTGLVRLALKRSLGLEPQQHAALRNALVDLFQKPRIAARVFEARAALFDPLFVAERGGMDGGLRAFPGGPRLGLDEGQLLQLLADESVEIANPRSAPLAREHVQVAAHGESRNAQLGRNDLDREALEPPVGD